MRLSTSRATRASTSARPLTRPPATTRPPPQPNAIRPSGVVRKYWTIARESVMHSPPVQPIASSTSGTGSVITMWLEVTVRRRRSGRCAARRPPAARTAAPSPHPPTVGLDDRPAGRRSEAPGPRALEYGHPPLDQLARSARGRGARAGPWRPTGRRRRSGTPARRSARVPRASSAGRRRPAHRARRTPRIPRARPRRGAAWSKPAGSPRGGTRRPPPPPRTTRRSPRRQRRWRERARAPRLAPKRSRSECQAGPHGVDEAPIAAARARSRSDRPRARRPAPRARAPRRTRRSTCRCTRRRRRRRRHRRSPASDGRGSGIPASWSHQPYASCFTRQRGCEV